MVRPPLLNMDDITNCPLCGVKVRIIRRADGAADHYEAIERDEANALAEPCPSVLADYLRASRIGKRTVAIVGSAHTTGPWAPYRENGIEVWCSNEMHGKIWMDEKYATAWFQIHPKISFTQEHRFDHWGWLQKEHSFPIYMHRKYDLVPSSVPYPLYDIQHDLIGNFVRGEEKVERLFSSTFSYQVALALHMRKFDRIELYGIELVLEGEYPWQREALAFWMGKADGMDVDIWLPEQCSLLLQPLYGYEEIRKGSTGNIIWSQDGAEK